MSGCLEMGTLLRAAAQPTVEMLQGIARDKPPVVRSILLAIAENFAEPGYKVALIKKRLKVNDRHLALFSSQVGLSAWSLIQECRMETGFRLLRDTLLSVDDVAILLGYDTKRPFEKLCRRWCGLSPAKLRESIRQAPQEVHVLGEEVFSWSFAVRLQRGEVGHGEVERIRACLVSGSMER